jgi:hypothetical protein
MLPRALPESSELDEEQTPLVKVIGTYLYAVHRLLTLIALTSSLSKACTPRRGLHYR